VGSPPADQTVSAEGANQSVSGTCTDKAGNSANATFSNINIDKTAPVLGALPNITKEATSGSGAIATYAATATDNLDATPTVSCAPASGSTFALGVTTVSCTASDRAGNSSGAKTFTITVQDTTPPVLNLPANITQEQIAPAGNAVTYTAMATDIVDGPVAVTCAPVSGTTFPRGTTTVNCSAKDAHNNTGTGAFTITVVDTIPPTGTIQINSGASYTNTTSVTLALTCTDGGSGCAQMAFSNDGTSYSSPVAFSLSYNYTLPAGDGPKTVYVKYTDVAGNISQAASATIGLDTAPPTSTLTFPGTGPYNAAGWHNSTAVCGISNNDPSSGYLCGTAYDAGTGASGVKKVEVSIKNGLGVYWNASNNAFTDSTETFIAAALGTPSAGTVAWNLPFSASNLSDGSYTVRVRAIDNAANTQSASTAITFTIDITPPTMSASAKANGVTYTSATWTKYDVVVSFSCSDSGSGLAAGSPPSPTTVSTEGANQSASGTCTDNAGNSASATFSNIKVDKTPPSAPVATVLPARNAAGWNNSLPVTVTFYALDNLSGVAGCTIPPPITGETGGTPVSGSCTDNAGNPGPSTTITVKADVTAPTVTNVAADPVALGAPGSLKATITDPQSGGVFSGIASAQYNIDGGAYLPMTIATTGSGAATVSTPLPSFTVTGVHKVCVSATDVAGNSSNLSCAFYAIYDPSAGFVTGGGWIDSPTGACTGALINCGTTATGKANFGFVSKYLKGAQTPSGDTEFDFKAGDLNFHSTIYQWLVVSGALAQYKGTGTINGQGNYTFMLTAKDGGLPGGGGADGLRMKITDSTGTVVIYDNLKITDDSMTNANVQVLGGGSIQIKSK